MKRLAALSFFLGTLLITFFAQATERSDFREFSIALAEGWKLQMDPHYHQYGVLAVFASGSSGDIKTLIVNFTSSVGKSMDELVSEAKLKAGARGASLEILKQTDKRAVYLSQLPLPEGRSL